MKFGAEDIQETAAALGFRPDSLEKVFRLLLHGFGSQLRWLPRLR